NSESSLPPCLFISYIPTLPSATRSSRYFAPVVNAGVEKNGSNDVSASRFSAPQANSLCRTGTRTAFNAINPKKIAAGTRASGVRSTASATNGDPMTIARRLTVPKKFPSSAARLLSPTVGDATVNQIAGAAIASDTAYTASRVRRRGSTYSRPTTSTATIGTMTAGCVACPNPSNTPAAIGDERRQQAIAANTNAVAQRNGSCPSSTLSTSIGSMSSTANHHAPRISGNAHHIAATVPRKPSTSHSVTVQSPKSGRTSAALNHGINPYGKAYASPC